MSTVSLRAVTQADLPIVKATSAKQGEEFEFYGFQPTNGLERWYAASGCLSEDTGMLVVVVGDEVLGRVSWHTVEYGPGSSSRAMRVGIAVLPAARGKGYGSMAQRLLAEYLFSTTRVQRVEAGTDIANVAEQKALEKAGFQREGVLRQAQYRDGTWHDMAIYSKLRNEPA